MGVAELHQELLDVAFHLAESDSDVPTQARLRRSASTAYYALFHFLISEATSNWSHPETRPALGRLFPHGRMKAAAVEKRAEAERLLTKNKEDREARSLHFVADTFIKLQQRREQADYDTSGAWTPIDAFTLWDDADTAVSYLKSIRHTVSTQLFLVSLFGKRSAS